MRRTGCKSGMGHQLPADRRFDINVDSEGGSNDENAPGQYKLSFELEHHSTTNQIPEGKKNQLHKIKGNSAGESKRLLLHPPRKCKT